MRPNLQACYTALSYAEDCPRWLKGHDWKSCVPFEAVPRVRIPNPPPDYPSEHEVFAGVI